MSFFSFSYFFSSASSIAAKQDSVNRLDQHYAIVGLSISCVWLLLVALTLRWIGPAWTRLAVLGGTMVIGRPLRWLALRELLSRYDSVLSQGISGMPATEVLARSFAGSSLSMTSRVLQERLEAGAPLGRALSTSQLSDGLCRPALLMIDEHPGDPRHAIGDVSNLLEQLAQERCRTLSVVLPVFVLLIVGTILWATFSSYLSALESLMHYISALV